MSKAGWGSETGFGMSPTGRWQLGLALAMTTAFLWGVLPIALKSLLLEMDAFTITWYRFLVASVLLGAILARRHRIPALRRLGPGIWGLLIVAAIGICGNYVLYLIGLDKVSPGTAQMVIQLAPMFLLLGGLIFFHESFSPWQWSGFAILVIGLLLFFKQRFGTLLASQETYLAGVLIIVVASLLWAGYALIQKQLFNHLSSDQILFLIYILSTLLFLPLSDLPQLGDLSVVNLWLLLFASLNTVIAYGAFAEAMVHWEASRVSAVLATTPLITLASMWVIARIWPHFTVQEEIEWIKVLGASLVVTGSVLTALSTRRRRPKKKAPLLAPLE